MHSVDISTSPRPGHPPGAGEVRVGAVHGLLDEGVLGAGDGHVAAAAEGC